MQISKAYMTEWKVINEPEDNGHDAHRVVAGFVVASDSVLALSVVALTASPARMTLDSDQVKGGGVEFLCEIRPPWGAKKRGGFQFKATMEYSGALVRQLAAVTQGVSLTMGLEILQGELELDPEKPTALGLFQNLEGATK